MPGEWAGGGGRGGELQNDGSEKRKARREAGGWKEGRRAKPQRHRRQF